MKKKIEVEAYIDGDGNPTCSLSIHDTCIFYNTEYFGIKEKCVIYGEYLHRKNNTGYLQPTSNCPIWGKKNEQS